MLILNNIIRDLKEDKASKEIWFNNKDVVAIDKKDLPSQGLFYADDLNIYIKPPSLEEVENYIVHFGIDQLNLVCNLLRNNVLVTGKRSIKDILSIDIMFLFLRCAECYNRRPFVVYDDFGVKINILDNLIKPQPPEKFKRNYNKAEKCFEIGNGFKFSYPTLGLELCLIDYLSNRERFDKYGEYSFRFMYFNNQKVHLKPEIMEYLLNHFNNDPEIIKISDQLDSDINEFGEYANAKIMFGYHEMDYRQLLDLANVFDYEDTDLPENPRYTKEDFI